MRRPNLCGVSANRYISDVSVVVMIYQVLHTNTTNDSTQQTVVNQTDIKRVHTRTYVPQVEEVFNLKHNALSRYLISAARS